MRLLSAIAHAIVCTYIGIYACRGSCPKGQSSKGPTPAWLEATRGPMTPSHICHPDAATAQRAREIAQREVQRAPNWANLGNCARTGRRRAAGVLQDEDVDSDRGNASAALLDGRG